jgi:hypothetical protein
VHDHIEQYRLFEQAIKVWTSPPGRSYLGTTSKKQWQDQTTYTQEEFPSMIYIYFLKNVSFTLKGTSEDHRSDISIKQVDVGGNLWIGHPNYQDLITFQEKLNPETSFDPLEDPELALIANLIEYRHNLEGEFSSAATLEDEVAQHFYTSADQWLVDMRNEPMFADPKHFETQSKQLFDTFFYPHLIEVYQNLREEFDPQTDTYCSPRSRKLIQQADLLASVTKQALDRYVDLYDLNPRSRELRHQDLSAWQKLPLNLHRLKNHLTLQGAKPLPLKKLEKTYQLLNKSKVWDQALSMHESWWLMNNLGSAISVLDRAAGMAYCGIMSQLTLDGSASNYVRFGNSLVPKEKGWRRDPSVKCIKGEDCIQEREKWPKWQRSDLIGGCDMCEWCDPRVKHLNSSNDSNTRSRGAYFRSNNRRRNSFTDNENTPLLSKNTVSLGTWFSRLFS